jgi:hypothetical protein
MPGHPRTIDEYLRPLTPKQRAALQKLRRAIRSAAPGAEEADRPLPATLVRMRVKTRTARTGR